MNEKFDIKIKTVNECLRDNVVHLSITHNGSTWTSIRILDPEFEIPKIIEVLKRHFIQVERTRMNKI